MERIAGTLLSQLDDWLQKVESTEQGSAQDTAEDAMNKIAVRAVFTQITMIFTVLGTDSESWKEIAEFVRQKRGVYKSGSVQGCLDVLATASTLFVEGL